jgi:hypothetical protein
LNNASDYTKHWLKPIQEEMLALLKKLYETTPFHLQMQPKLPARGQERPGIGWIRGHWLTAKFPVAVSHLNDLLSAKQRRFEELDRGLPGIKSRVQELFDTRRWVEVKKNYVGIKRVEDQVRQRRLREHYPQRWSTTPELRPAMEEHREPWYDYETELDQTHADRAAEIATELASLPKYVAYCKLLDEHGNPHEFRFRTRQPAEAVGTTNNTDVAERSRQLYGTAAAVVEEEVRIRQESEDESPSIGRRT